MTPPPETPFEFAPPAPPNDLGIELTAIIARAQLCVGQPQNASHVAAMQGILDSSRDLLQKIDRESQGETGTPPTKSADPHAAHCKVLYIEDNLVNYALVSHIFAARPNFRLKQAVTGEAGLTVAFSEPLDIILLDLNLPGVHGSEVLGQLQENPTTAHVPVIVISADATASQIERLLAAGARDYLIKPFNVQKFLALMDTVVGEIPRSGRA